MNKYKLRLLLMAENNEPKPRISDDIYSSFIRYTNINNLSYDKDFTDKLFALRPDWEVVGRKVTVAEKKNTLLLMAKNNEPKPRINDAIYI